MTLALAMVLDAILGEPRWLWSRAPHPAVLMGRVIGWADSRFNHGTSRRAKGVCLAAALLAGGLLIGALLASVGWPVQAIAAASDTRARPSDRLRSLKSGVCAIGSILM